MIFVAFACIGVAHVVHWWLEPFAYDRDFGDLSCAD